MSDTPRVDSYVYKFPGCQREPRLIDFARQLEKELAEAQAEIEKLNKNHSDALDTILAMLIAARGEECDLETLEREMNAVSTKPSGYIRHCIAERDKLIEQMTNTLRSAEQFIENGIEFGYIRMPDPETPDKAHKMLPEIKAALLAAERRGK